MATMIRQFCTVLYCTVLYCTVLYCTVLYCTVPICLAQDKEEEEKSLNQYIKSRDGLPHVIEDIRHGNKTCITIFGHRAFSKKIKLSSTVGANRINIQPQVYTAYASYTPGVMSTSSSYGCLGYGHQPGFVIFDTFSYDQDSNVSVDQIRDSLVFLKNRMDIKRDYLLIYSPGQDFFNVYKTEQYNQKLSLYEAFAEENGIPTINLCDYVQDLISKGIIKKDECEDYLFDYDHRQTNSKAARIFQERANELLSDLFEKIISAGAKEEIQIIEENRAKNKKTIINNRVSYEQDDYPKGWLPWQLSNIDLIEHILEGTGEEAYSFPFYGASIGLSGISDPGCGDLLYSIDDSEWQELTIGIPETGTFTYEYLLKSDLKDNEDHILKIKSSNPDKKVKIDHFFVTSVKTKASAGSLEEINAIYKKIPPLSYKPSSVLDSLPETKKKLENGGSLKILMLGDSIMNGISSSNFQLLIKKMYPKCSISVQNSLRGSTGCWYYKDEAPFRQYVGQKNFDLIIIGGISHRNDIDAIKSVVDQIREKKPNAEIILMTDAWGNISHLNYEDTAFDHLATEKDKTYQGKLLALSLQYEKGVAYMDITFPWAQYLRKAKELNVPYVVFKKDNVHANQFGNQVLARIIETYFAPKGYDPCEAWEKEKASAE